MKTEDISSIALVVFDHKFGPRFVLEKKNSSDVTLLENTEQTQLIELISSRKYIPNDFLYFKIKESSKYVFGSVYECKTKTRSDLFFIFLITSPKATYFELKILLMVMTEIITIIYPKGFSNVKDGENFVAIFSNACKISKKNNLILQNYTIDLEQLKSLAPKYHLKDETGDILNNQFG